MFQGKGVPDSSASTSPALATSAQGGYRLPYYTRVSVRNRVVIRGFIAPPSPARMPSLPPYPVRARPAGRPDMVPSLSARGQGLTPYRVPTNRQRNPCEPLLPDLGAL